MGSMANARPWMTYMNTKDCSQGFCSLYCPQWCYIILPPPPPFEFPDDSSGPNFSPIVIAIIGTLASAFLVVSYYTIISKYCKNRDSSRRRENNFPDVESEENQDPSNHEAWHVSANGGLDEALIKSITAFKYKKADGLIEGTDCSVCLSEFQDDESLRLLPKCSHAFHVLCIDTWLKSHSNCPLCRANVVFVNALPSQWPPVIESAPTNEPSLHGNSEIENVASEEDLEMGIRERDSQDNIAKTPNRQASDLGTSDDGIRDYEVEFIRRSVSMGCISQCPLSIADVLRINQDEEDQMQEDKYADDVGTSNQPVVEISRSSHRSRMKRSFSSGRFLFSNERKGRNVTIPL